MSTPTGPRPAVATPSTGGRASTGAAPASFRTPTTATRATPGGAGRRTPGTARTPHARAAMLALDSRRAALFTPGGRQTSRRKSGRYLRESPRDLLRNLSRRLAPTERVVSSSPAAASARADRTLNRSARKSFFEIDDDDDSIPLDRPRLSLPIDLDEDNDDDLRPHRSTILEADEDEEGNLTMRSIEMARRTATQEQLQQARRFSRGSLGSFGSMRMSDYIDGFIGGDDDAEAEDAARSAFFPEGVFDNLANEQPSEDNTFERLDSDDRRTTLAAGRESIFGAIDVPLDGNDTTVILGAGEDDTDQPLGEPLGDGGDDAMPADDNGAALFGDYDAGYDDPGAWLDEPDATAGVADENVAAATIIEAASKQSALSKARGAQPKAKRIKLSRHGIPYPSLPVGVVKRVAQTFAQSSGAGKAKLSPDTVAALSTASDWFFEQIGVDLQRFAKHAGRKTIDESDMLILMKRQRQISSMATPFSLAQRLLPRELLQEMRMTPETPIGKPRKHRQPRRPRTATATGEDRT